MSERGSGVNCHICSASIQTTKAFSLHEKWFCSLDHVRQFKALLPPEPEQKYQRFYNINGYHHH